MARTIPTVEPTQARAGETWDWKRSLSDYPADTWTLAYQFTNATSKITITASADGFDHLVTAAKAVTALYAAGDYTGFAQVTDGTSTYTVWSGFLEVLPDLSSATAYDGRSHARKMLDAIEALLEGRGTADQLDLVSSAIGDRSLARKPETLLPLRDRYKAEALREEMALRTGTGGRILVRQ